MGTLTKRGEDYIAEYWSWKLTAPCGRCTGKRFVNLYDVGAPGPSGEGLCGACGEDLKLPRAQRTRRLRKTWDNEP